MISSIGIILLVSPIKDVSKYMMYTCFVLRNNSFGVVSSLRESTEVYECEELNEGFIGEPSIQLSYNLSNSLHRHHIDHSTPMLSSIRSVILK